MPAKPAPPDDAHLAKFLGPAFKHWQFVISDATSNHAAKAEWKHYAGKLGGWRLVLKSKARNLAYLKPDDASFLASLALSDADLDHAEQAKAAPPALLADIRAGPKFPEGRAARISVSTAASARHVARLITIKAAR